MNALLEPTFLRLEKQREEFCAWVQKAPAPLQHKQPGPNQWSAAQVLFHLARVDQQVVNGLENRLKTRKALKPLKLATKVRSLLLNLLLKLPIKFKAPPQVREVPEQVDLVSVMQEWKETREKLHNILTAYPTQQLGKEVFFHPRAGMLTMPQTLTFLVEHTEHHRRQMRRLLS
ncbi:DinB family protein [Rufibacter tibetensis]|uniref:DinB-like domain-containing protein n=1 Tax=Rufibacter tibetensis TaxID=512763 RepID=A0A0N7HWV5_9BACT|nr:DinB family protein [Rufibacter tibetensis]ALJ00305.1 hypothetical protein DC20_16670 [Rufibacter tibetensis]